MRQNNFDLLRLAAAIQVLLIHGVEHLGLKLDALHRIFSIFPGVPIFFVISGFLISASYERNNDLAHYAQNRLLRIVPGLWVCLAISIVLATVIGGVIFPPGRAIIWIAAQASIAQFYNPEFLRGFGTGVLNGSLWTISLELQFYIAVPFIYWVIRGSHKDRKLLIGVVIFAIVRLVVVAVTADESRTLLQKLAGVLLPAHLYLFLVGIFLQRNHLKMRGWIDGRGIHWLVGYTVLALTCTLTGISEAGNKLHPLLTMLLGVTVVSLAMTAPRLSNTLLKGNDISYGIYIYQMPIINCLIYLGITNSSGALGVGAALAVGAGVLSWKLVEQPFLRLKRNPLHPVKKPGH
jgi:peptidoglycan/LPS O-acetylase OafA/YrhL